MSIAIAEPPQETDDLRQGPTPVIYRVKEYAPAEVPLRDLLDDSGELRLNPDVEAKDYFTVQLVKGRVRLQARGYVGVIPLNDRVIIDVVPRAPVRNLSRLLMVSRQIPDLLRHSRRYSRDQWWADSLLDVYANALVSYLEEIASQGLLREYHRHEEATSYPHGRILASATIRRFQVRGVKHKVAASWFERSPDNAANRCLKYALWFLATRLSALAVADARRRELLQRLAPVYELLSGVALDHSLDFLHDGIVRGERQLPTLRSYYRPALDNALAIVLEHGVRIETEGDAVELPSLVLNMNRLFEHYLRNVLREQGRERRWVTEVLDGNAEGKKLLFDDLPSEEATPDIVVKDPADNHCPLIVEVKNVPVKGDSDRSAVEQAITYGASYRCDHVVLAHPRAHQVDFSGLRLQGRLGDLSRTRFDGDRFCWFPI